MLVFFRHGDAPSSARLRPLYEAVLFWISQLDFSWALPTMIVSNFMHPNVRTRRIKIFPRLDRCCRAPSGAFAPVLGHSMAIIGVMIETDVQRILA
jgi:hypothetical protein